MKNCGIVSPASVRDPFRSVSGIFGAHVASSGWIDAALHHGSYDRYIFFVTDDKMAPHETAQASLRRSVGAPEAHERVITAELVPSIDACPPVCDLSVVHNPAGPDLYQQALLRRRLHAHCPLTSVHHTISYPDQQIAFLKLLLSDIRVGDAVVCTSTAAQRTLKHRLADAANLVGGAARRRLDALQLPVIPLGVDDELYAPVSKPRSRHLLGLPQDPVVIVHFGRLSPHDKTDLLPLFTVMQTLRAEGLPVHLVVAGEDRHAYTDTLRRIALAAGLADVVSIVADPSVATNVHFYGAADIVVCMCDNIQETFGQVPLEAMSCGRPVVAADWDGYRDTVVDGHTGYLVPTVVSRDALSCIDPAAMINAWQLDHLAMAQSVAVDIPILVDRIRRLVVDRQLRARLGKAGRWRVQANYAWARVMGAYESLWADLLDMSVHAPAAEGCDGPFYADTDYFRWFGHYASRTLSDADVVGPATSPSAYGIEDVMFAYPSLRHRFRPEVLGLVLETVDQGPIAVGEVKGRLRALCSEEAVVRATLCLVKHGMLRLVPNKEAGCVWPHTAGA